MVSYKIGGLPVVQGKNLAGIITETDLFKVFLNLLGGRRPGVRITVLIPNVKGTIAQISKAIFNAGGNIVGLGTIESPKTDNEMWECVFKVQGVSQAQLMDIVGPVVHEITDIRSQ
jgi:acetoin utilization protein AcuB